jgi:hypothetical protein
MSCRNIRKRLSAYQDRELSSDEQDRIKSHLKGCPECSGLYAELQHTWEALGEAPEIHPSPGFYLEIRKKIVALNDRRFIPRLRQVFQFLPSPLATATLVLAGLVIGSYVGNFFFQEGLIYPQDRQPGFSQLDASIASIRTFDPIPPGTLAHGYLSMASYQGSAH